MKRTSHNVSGRGGVPADRRELSSRAAFTLIEMMVVVALIGILIGGVFRLIGAANESAKKGQTIDRMQRLENALSGFYAINGTYPPVAPHGSPDPFTVAPEDSDHPEWNDPQTTPERKLELQAIRAAHRQPTAFEFPTPKSLDADIPMLCGQGIQSANVNPGDPDSDAVSWPQVKLFRYGVLSFLLPRLLVIGGTTLADGTLREKDAMPDLQLLEKAIWNKFNLAKYEGKEEQFKKLIAQQSQHESEACARLLPNLEKIVFGGVTLLGVDTAAINARGIRFSQPYTTEGDKRIVLGKMTLFDGWSTDHKKWDNELYYYSAPPYQSYRVWSAGPNGKTFPPWIPLDSVPKENLKDVNEWVSDDIARFDR